MMALLISLATGALAADPPPNPAFAPIEDDPSLPRVLLIGDSISVGYTLPTRELLSGKANVHRALENCGTTIKGLERIEHWLGEGKWDLIHFNWGLHDLKIMEDGKHQVAIDEYEKNLRTLVERLKQTGAKLIWAATTPVPDAEVNPPRSDEDAIAYNEVADRIMDEHGVTVDDLYSFALPRLEEIQQPANVHFTADGSKALAKRVAECIVGVLGRSR